MLAQPVFVNGERICNVTLANDAATSTTQGEMDFPSLLRLRIMDSPSLFSGEDQIQPGFFTTSNIFVERRRALLLPASFFFRPEVVLPLLAMTPLPPLLAMTPLAV